MRAQARAGGERERERERAEREVSAFRGVTLDRNVSGNGMCLYSHVTIRRKFGC